MKHRHCSCYSGSRPADHYLAQPGHCCECSANNMATANGRAMEKAMGTARAKGKVHTCISCGKSMVYGDSLQRHRAVCSVRLRATIRSLVELVESLGGRRREMWPPPIALVHADEVLKEDPKGRT